MTSRCRLKQKLNQQTPSRAKTRRQQLRRKLHKSFQGSLVVLADVQLLLHRIGMVAQRITFNFNFVWWCVSIQLQRYSEPQLLKTENSPCIISNILRTLVPYLKQLVHISDLRYSFSISSTVSILPEGTVQKAYRSTVAAIRQPASYPELSQLIENT